MYVYMHVRFVKLNYTDDFIAALYHFDSKIILPSMPRMLHVLCCMAVMHCMHCN